MFVEFPDIHIHVLAPLLFFFLYAEIHFRFPGIPSRYFIKQPEILADIPHRIDPGQPLPVLIIVKDANRFPVTLQEINVDVILANKQERIYHESLNLNLESEFWENLVDIKVSEKYKGRIQIDVEMHYSIAGKSYCIKNDNYTQTSHAPFDVLIDTQPLPKSKDWYFGDLHYHSNYTSDQVEFGAPISASKTIAKRMGIDFFAVSDHSYDLDDHWNNYLKNDPDLKKWKHLWQTVEQINSEDDSFVIIPGEELSAGNHKSQNVHFLILNNREFFTGYGDSAEKILQTRPQWQISNVLKKLSPQAVSIASHPETNPPFVQRLLINRGKWHHADYTAQGLTGVQMWNGDKEHFLKHGLSAWIDLLLQGYKPVLLAGNDAHGNFNRFRQLSTPFWSMKENHLEVFAIARTGVFVEDAFSLDSLLQSIQKGKAIVTDGLFADLILKGGNKLAKLGDTVQASNVQAEIKILSSPAFGEISFVDLYIGDKIKRSELQQPLDLPRDTGYSLELNVQLNDLPKSGYIRLVTVSKSKDREYHCFTNPVFID